MGRKPKELQLIEATILVLMTKWVNAELAMENFKSTKELQAKYGELGRMKTKLIEAIQKRDEFLKNGGKVEQSTTAA